MKRKAWTVMLVAFLAGIALAWVQNKIPPVITTLMDAFQIDMTTAGWLSSIFSIMGMATAIPAAVIINKLGPKVSGLLSLAAAVIGSLIGVFSDSVAMMMVSRVVEGLGVGIIAVVAPTLISMWFPPEKRGFPMGIWGSWQMVAQAITFFVGASLTVAFGWQGMWYAGIALCILGFILYGIFIASPPAENNYADVESDTVSIWEAFKSGSTWWMAGVAFFFCIGCFGWCTWTAPYWSEAFGWDIGVANNYVGLIYMLEIPFVFLIGYLLDKVADRKRFGVILAALYVIVLFVSFRMHNPSFIIPFVIIYPFLEGSICTTFWTLCPQTVKKPEQAAMALAIMVTFMNLGMVLGPPLEGAVVEAYGWAAGTIPLALAALLALICMGMSKIYQHDVAVDAK
ncbi:MAG TPA: MFS transporter [Syntrophomonas sp.]|nr:MFS transporter [Syntrophomonas sp.]